MISEYGSKVIKRTRGRISAELDAIKQKALSSEKRATAAEVKHEEILLKCHDLQETNSLLHKFSNVFSMSAGEYIEV